MTVSLIRSAESHTGTTGSVSQASYTWALGIAGDAPRGVVVFTMQGVLAADAVTAVTYGGVALTKVTGGAAADTVTEPGRVTTWLLGASVPSGAQSVVVTRTSNTATCYGVGFLLGGSAAIVSYGTPGYMMENGAAVALTINPGTATSIVLAALYTGGSTAPTASTGMTLAQTLSGSYAYAFGAAYETTPTTGSRARGLVAATDDLAYVVCAFREVAGVVSYAATGRVDAVSGLSGSATVKRAATGAAGAVVTGISGTATVTETVSIYPATGHVDSSTAVSGTATVKRAASGVAGSVVTGASAAALAKHFATGSASVVTTLSGAAFRRYSATGTVAAVTGSSATPKTKRAATGSAAAATGLNGTAAAKHPVTGLAGAVTTGTSGVVTVKRRTSGTPSINVVTVLSGAATVTEAPTGNYATGQADAVTGLSGRANVTRAASGAVTSSTTVSGAALARHGVTGNVSSASSLSGAVTLLVAVTGSVEVVTGISGTPRSDAVTYPASGRINVVTTICDATVYAAAGLISAGSSRGMGTPGHRSGFTSTGGRGIAATALGRGRTSEGHERTTP